MAGAFLSAKDWVMSKMTPDCIKSKVDEAKNLADEAKSKMSGGHDPDDPANKGKITEWEAGWNVTNAIQVLNLFKNDFKK